MSPYWLVCLVPLLVAIALLVGFRTSRYYRLLSKLPGPRGLPLIGDLLSVLAHTNCILDYFMKLRDEYGLIEVGWMGPYAVVMLFDPRDVEIVLNSNECLSKPAPYRLLELCFGYSVITARREDWKRYRKIMHSSFSTQTVATFVPTFNEKAKVLIRVIRNRADRREFDILGTMMLCTLDIVTDTSLGMNMNLLDENRVELAESFHIIRDVLYSAVLRPWYWVPFLMKKTPSYKKMLSGLQPLWDLADNIIARKLLSHEKSNASVCRRPSSQENFDQAPETPKKYLGFMDHVISCMRSQSVLLTRTELKDNTVTVILGGMNTSSIVVSAVLMLLGLHQDVQRKVVTELGEIFGDDMHREVTVDDLRQMMYLEQVINETMRLYPPLPGVMRAFEEEVNLTQYTIPKGTFIVLPIYTVHRSPELFPDPEKFDPDRFSPENCASRHPYSFIPFLSGRRMCIGKKYAYLQMKTLLSTLLRSYEVLPCCSREEIEQVQFKLTLNFINGCKVKLTPRKL